MKKHLNSFIFAIIAAAGLFVAVSSVYALGQLTKPIVVDNARRGQVITEKLKLFNSEKADKVFGLVADEDVATWAKFYKVKDLKNPIDSISIPAQSNIDAVVVITVPTSTTNGVYKGGVSVTSAPVPKEKTEGSSVDMVQKVTRPVTITVVGEEQYSAEVSVIPESYAVDAGKPLSIRFLFYNTGNVDITPEIRIKFKDIDKKGVLDSINFPFPESMPAIKPLERIELPAINVPTTNLADGRYWVETTIVEKDKELYKNEFRVQIGQVGQVLGESVEENVNAADTDNDYNIKSMFSLFMGSILFLGVVILAVLALVIYMLYQSRQPKKVVKKRPVKKAEKLPPAA